MAITKLPEVTIGGTDQIFGGNIYELSFDVKAGLEGKYSTLNVKVVSEDGNYQISESDLDLSIKYYVRIGTSFEMPMYLLKYKKNYSPKGNLLEVTFIDGSFVLDKYWVGLLNSVWTEDAPAQEPSWLIVVGNEINPCDPDNDGTRTWKDQIDPCDPCITAAIKQGFLNGTVTAPELQQGILDCDQLEMFSILDVKYTFDELIAEATLKTGLAFQNAYGEQIYSPNENVKEKFSGTLREVLKNWCKIWGWSFFFTDNAVIFIDSSHGIQVAKTVQDFCPNVGEYSEEYSLEGTVTGNLIQHFKRPGKWHDYTCTDARYIAMTPYMPGQEYSSPVLTIDEDVDPIVAGFAHYDVGLRDLYYWFMKYQMFSADQIQPMLEFPELGLICLTEAYQVDVGGISTDDSGIDPTVSFTYPAGYPLNNADTSKNFLDSTDITGPLLQVQAAIEADEDFKKLFSLLAPKDQWQYAQYADQYYLFIGYYDTEVEDQHVNDEKDFAEGFLGKYYVYTPNLNDPIEAAFFEDERIINDITRCGRPEQIPDGRLKFSSVRNDADKDTVEYYDAPALAPFPDADVRTLSKLPFARFLKIFRDNDGQAQKVIGDRTENFKMVQVTVNGERFYPSSSQRVADDGTSPFNIQNKQLLAQAHNYYLSFTQSKLDQTGDDVLVNILLNDSDVLDQLDDNVKDTRKIFLFMGREASQDDFQFSQSPLWYHELQEPGYYFDGHPLNTRIDEITNASQIVYQYPFLRCKLMARWNNFAPHYTFTTPVGQFEYTGPCNATFGVIIEKEKKITQRWERVQMVDINEVNAPNTLKLQVSQRDITDDDINKRIMRESTCLWNPDTINAYFEQQANGCVFENTIPQVRKDITIAGIASFVPSITQGLLGIDMTIGDEGLKTTYHLGTSEMTPPSSDDGADIYHGLPFSISNASFTSVPVQPPYKQSYP